MGIGTYGRTFTLRNPSPCALGVAAIGAGQPGPYTSEAGTLGYNEVHHTNYLTLSQKITSQSQEVTKTVKGLEEIREQEL
jgi:hypothetical protein